ncbi:MAG: serine/threonine protein kinase [Planctomycetota bacterium]|nr:MAG: serine/threonine protein kinase [Planctomycetota bacterium]
MPSVVIICPRCHRHVHLRQARVGQVQCPHCGHRWVPRRSHLAPLQPGGDKRRLNTVSLSAPPQPSPVGPPAADPDSPIDAATNAESSQRSARTRARMRVRDVLEQSVSDAPADVPAPAAPSSELGLLDALVQADQDAAAQSRPPSSQSPTRQPSPRPRVRMAPPQSSKPESQRFWRAQQDPLVGKEMRGLRIERKIGEGGMGAVYEAIQLSLERKVALKVLNPRLRGDASFIAKLEAEAKILARINHNNILHVYDFGEDTTVSIYFMVMEYVDGSDLTELLQRRGRLGQVEALEIIRQAALGLDAAAQNGIIHRDLKPDNIMISKEGVCKVSDFGLATDISIGTGDAAARVGTPAFMSPEQCQGLPLDVRSDVYSLGCTAYVALTGHLPFEGESPMDIMIQQRTTPPPLVGQDRPGIDSEAEAVVQRMMAKNPQDRYPSMAAVAESLKALVERLLNDPSGGTAPPTAEMTPDLPSWLNEE